MRLPSFAIVACEVRSCFSISSLEIPGIAQRLSVVVMHVIDSLCLTSHEQMGLSHPVILIRSTTLGYHVPSHSLRPCKLNVRFLVLHCGSGQCKVEPLPVDSDPLMAAITEVTVLRYRVPLPLCIPPEWSLVLVYMVIA